MPPGRVHDSHAKIRSRGHPEWLGSRLLQAVPARGFIGSIPTLALLHQDDQKNDESDQKEDHDGQQGNDEDVLVSLLTGRRLNDFAVFARLRVAAFRRMLRRSLRFAVLGAFRGAVCLGAFRLVLGAFLTALGRDQHRRRLRGTLGGAFRGFVAGHLALRPG